MNHGADRGKNLVLCYYLGMNRKVAIFDIDGTIFRSSLLAELVEALVDKGLLPPKSRDKYEQHHKKWLDREGNYGKYIEAVIAVFVENLKGVSYKDFMAVSHELIEQKKKHVYCYTRDLIKDLQKKDYFLLAISQSPKIILDAFCEELGFDKVYGRMYEVGPTDKFTGKVIDEHLIANKANIVKRAIEKNNLTLKGSIGVGDTEDDIPMLEIVEKPICFNPNSKLFKYGKLNDWKIVVERKDVVYDIN